MSFNSLLRLQGIPMSLNKAEVRAHLKNDPEIRFYLESACEGEDRPLKESYPSLIPEQSEQLLIITLAHSPGDKSENTAIWKFPHEIDPRFLEKLNGKIIQCSCLACRPTEGVSIGSFMVIDYKFYGLTSLHSPAEHVVEWDMNIVALSGCMKHPVDPFTPNSGDFMWLRDELPEDIPTAKIFLYGYDTRWVRNKATNIIDRLGSDFVAALQSLQSGPFLALRKPLVLIGHSIGGIIIKEAIMQMLRRAESGPLAIINSIAGILFFDTPHSGMDPFYSEHEPLCNTNFLDYFSRESTMLVQHAKDFEELFCVDDCDIICFYASPTASYYSMPVGQNSATSCKPQGHVSFQQTLLERDHFDIVKFNPHDFDYLTKIRPKLQEYRKRGEVRPELGSETVFRLRGIPLDCSIDELPSLIRTGFSVPRATHIHLGSMATNPIESTELTATLSFSSVPVNLSKKLSRHGSGDEWHFHQLKVGRFGSVYLVLDKHFRGLTPLHSCADDKCGTDLIALSGLNGHAFGSFKVKGGSFMWLRDTLPAKLPGTRILVYGYDTQLVDSRSFQTLQDLGMSLRDNIHMIEIPKPTILLGHSLGGLVAKQAMAAMNQYATPRDVDFLRSVQGILFFGTPHLGMDTSSLIPLVGENPNKALLDSLNADSTELARLATEFERALMHGSVSIRSFYETAESPTAIKTQGETDDSTKQVWSMRGPPAKLVTVRSAKYGVDEAHPINRNHSDLVKFDGPYDPIYRHVLGLLRRMAQGDVQTTVRKAAVIQQKGSWQAILEALFA